MATYKISVAFSVEVERDEEPNAVEAAELLLDAFVGGMPTPTVERVPDTVQVCSHCRGVNASDAERCHRCGWTLW